MGMCRYLLARNINLLVLRQAIAWGLIAVLASFALSACGSAPRMALGTDSVVSAPVRIAHTSLGAVGYRIVGSGPPLVLIMGYGWTMEGWIRGWSISFPCTTAS
jgi:hypothetical protein